MKTVRGFLILIACFNLGIETAGQMLFTPPMAFEDNNFPRCISALSDSALVWEEQSFWERYEGPGPIRVEICESFTVSRTSFYHDEGEEDKDNDEDEYKDEKEGVVAGIRRHCLVSVSLTFHQAVVGASRRSS